jgi:hypothetical protein
VLIAPPSASSGIAVYDPLRSVPRPLETPTPLNDPESPSSVIRDDDNDDDGNALSLVAYTAAARHTESPRSEPTTTPTVRPGWLLEAAGGEEVGEVVGDPVGACVLRSTTGVRGMISTPGRHLIMMQCLLGSGVSKAAPGNSVIWISDLLLQKSVNRSESLTDEGGSIGAWVGAWPRNKGAQYRRVSPL